jgi:hypothetical protein
LLCIPVEIDGQLQVTPKIVTFENWYQNRFLQYTRQNGHVSSYNWGDGQEVTGLFFISISSPLKGETVHHHQAKPC